MSQKEPGQPKLPDDLAEITGQSPAGRLVRRLAGQVTQWTNELLHGREITFDRLAREMLNVTVWQQTTDLTPSRIRVILANVVEGAPNNDQWQKGIEMLDILSLPQKGALIRHTDEEPVYDELTREQIFYSLKQDPKSQDLLREIANGKSPVELILLYNQTA